MNVPQSFLRGGKVMMNACMQELTLTLSTWPASMGFTTEVVASSFCVIINFVDAINWL